MERTTERGALAAVALGVIALGFDGFLLAATGLTYLRALWPYLAALVFVGGTAWLRAWLARRSEEERQDAEVEARERPASGLFGPGADGSAEPFTVARSREQFERWFVPWSAPLLAALEAGAAWWLVRTLRVEWPVDPRFRLLAAAVLAGQAFAFFLPSRYLLGLARSDGTRLVRAPGILCGLVALLSLLGSLAAVAAELGWAAAPRLAAWVPAIGLAVMAVEHALVALAALYRPRGAAGPLPCPYETRLGRLLTDPAGWVEGAAAALDYQFGFKVSETWLVRFLTQAVVPLVLFQLAVLYGLSCVVIIEPHEAGVLERFGRPRADGDAWRLGPGLHAKWPWPFETVRRFPAGRVLRTHVGYTAAPDDLDEAILWTRPHYRDEDTFLVATADAAGGAPATSVPVNLVSFAVPIEYRISDLRAYAYRYAEPEALLQAVAYRALTREVAGRDLFDLLGQGRQEAAEALLEGLREEVARLGMGVEVLFVGLRGVHPPVAVADAFESVVGALEEREARILGAMAGAVRATALGAAEARRTVLTAEGDSERRSRRAEAERDAFLDRLAAHDAAPSVFRSRYRLGVLRQALAGARRYVVAATPDREVIRLDLDERTPARLFDASPPAEDEEKTAP